MVGSPSVIRIRLGRRVTLTGFSSSPASFVTGTSTCWSVTFSRIRLASRIPHWVGVEPCETKLLTLTCPPEPVTAVATTLTWEFPVMVKKAPLLLGLYLPRAKTFSTRAKPPVRPP